MVRIEDQYFRLNRMLLFAVGGWYSQTSIFASFYRIINYVALITFIIVQFIIFVTSKCNMDRIVKVLSIANLTICQTAEYHMVLMNREVVKDILTALQRIYDETKDENEIAIFHKHACLGVRYTILFIAIFFSAGIIITITQFWPIILDIVLPLNESRPLHLLVEVEYFVDQEKYFYIIILHIALACLVGNATATLFGTVFITCYQYIRSIFRIASYRIEQVMRSSAQKNIKKNEKWIFEVLICAIRIHCKATELAECIMSSYRICILIVSTILGFTVSLNMLQIVLNGKAIENALVSLILTTGILVHIFVISYIGQQVIDDNNNIFVTAYNVPWYDTSLRIQRLILFSLQRGNKTFGLSIYGLLFLSLETFTKILSIMISYFTVFYSLQ